MPVNATIPLTQDFLETAASYPFLTELIQHPTNGYVYGCYQGNIIKLSATNFSDVTVSPFVVDGKHTTPIDMHYSAATDRFYVLFRIEGPSELLVTSVNPTTLAKVDFISDSELNIGPGSITGDATNLYICSFNENPSVVYAYRLSDGQFVPGSTATLTGFTQAHCIRQFGGKLFLQGMTPPVTGWVMRLSTAGVVEETATFTGEEGEFPVDEIGESAGHIWVGNRDLSGEIRKYSKTSFINPEVILTTQLSKCTCVKTVGGFVWAAFENGRGVRIYPANVADRRIYTLNAGEGYHSEFTGGSEFVYTYNYFAGKIARYRIPPDGASGSGSMLWLVDVAGQLVANVTGRAFIKSVAVDLDGNVIGIGQIVGTVNVGLINGVMKQLSSESAAGNIFIAKWNSAGQLQWAQRYGGATQATPNELTVDSNGDIIVTGGVGGIGDLGGGNLGGAGNIYGFLAKYRGTDGTWVWSFIMGVTTSGLSTTGVGVAVRGNNIFLAGNFNIKTNLGGSDLNSAGGSDLFIAKYNHPADGFNGPASAVHVWGIRHGTSTFDTATGLAMDSAGNLFVSGATWGSINFGGGARTQVGTSQFFVVKFLGSTGAHVWDQVRAPVGDSAQANCVTVDAADNVIIGGDFRGTLKICPSPNASDPCPSATTDLTYPGTNTAALFIAKFSNAGTLLSARALGGITSNVGGESAKVITTDANLNVIFAGISSGQINWGNSVFTTGNGAGAFVLGKLSPSLATLTTPGNNLWPKLILHSGGDNMTVDGIALEAVTANTYVAGSITSTANFGGGPCPGPTCGEIASPSYADGWLVKYAF